MSKWTGNPAWAVFHRSLNCGIPDYLPLHTSLDHIRQYLLSERKIRGKGFEQIVLCLLGPPHLEHDIKSLGEVKGMSQTYIPSYDLLSPVKIVPGLLRLDTHGNIMFPKTTDLSNFQGLAPWMITLGRFIEDVDSPSRTYFDSVIATSTEKVAWDRSASVLQIESVMPVESTMLFESQRFLTTKGVNYYRPTLSLMIKDPMFPLSSEKKMLMEWISHRKVGFLVTAYQTYVDATIKESRVLKGRRTLKRTRIHESKFTNHCKLFIKLRG